MALIKKTVVLVNNGAEGYVTVVRVGDEVGAKIVGSSFEKGMLAALKIGLNPVFYTKLDGPKTEINMNTDFNQNDDINCLIMDNDLFVAKAGKLLDKQELMNYFRESVREILVENEIEEAQLVDSSFAEIKDYSEVKTKLSEVEVKENIENITEILPQTEKKTSAPKNLQKNKAQVQGKSSTAENLHAKNAVSDSVQDTRKDTENAIHFFNGESIPPNLDTESEKDFLARLQNGNGKNFYQNVKERLDELFVIHPRETELEKIIPESKWVKIKYDGEDYYVVGSLSDNGTIVYLSYGVPGKADVPPPKLASDISDWLPISGLPEPYEGYWLIFQDAESGKVGNIK